VRAFLDKVFVGLLGLCLIARLFIETSLKNFGPLGAHKIGDLSIDLFVMALVFLYFLKKLILNEKIILPWAWLILVLFGCICTASIFYSIDVPTSILGVFDLWAFIFLVGLLINLLDSLKNIQIIVFFLMAVALMASGEALYEYFFQLPWYIAHANPQMLNGHRDLEQLILTHRTPTLFLWPNTMAGFLIMVLPLCAALFVQASQIRYKILSALIGGILIYTLFIELSISTWISLFLAVGILVIYFKDHFLNKNSSKWVMGGVALLALGVVVVVIKKISFSYSNSFSSRQDFFMNAFYLIGQHPLRGNGWSSFGTASAPFAQNANGLTNYAHNSYIQIFAETGLLGFFVFTVFLVFLWKDAMLLIKEKKYRWLLLGLWTAIAACMLDNSFSYTMLLPNSALYWWVIVGISLSLQAVIEPSRSIIVGMRSKIFFAVASLCLLGMGFRFTQAEYYYFTALPYIHANIEGKKAVTLFQKADALNPWDKKFELAESVAYYELFSNSGDKKYLELAHETVLKTMGQASLGAERQAVLDRITTAS